jgi:hypothetical protein
MVSETTPMVLAKGHTHGRRWQAGGAQALHGPGRRPRLSGRLTRSARRHLLHLPANWSWASQFLGALGLPRFDGQGWWLGQAACVRASLRVAVSNSLGVM